ncbi:MAG: M67 family metallopeptidase [Actinomycetia bacterium]|nr:M67 family metallopeptidase [Actinomycetes bacterium]
MLTMQRRQWLEMLAEAWDTYPLEGCGLLIGPSLGSSVVRFEPIYNEARSSRIYRLDGAQHARAAMRADRDGLDVIGVMHSHTHTAAYPSLTDVGEASKPLIPPSWHWVIVSLAWGYPELRSFKLVDEGIEEETVRLSY